MSNRLGIVVVVMVVSVWMTVIVVVVVMVFMAVSVIVIVIVILVCAGHHVKASKGCGGDARWPEASGLQPHDEQPSTDDRDQESRDCAEPREEPFWQNPVRGKQGEQPEREHAGGMRDGHRDPQDHRVLRRSPCPDEVGRDNRLAVAGREGMDGTECG